MTKIQFLGHSSFLITTGAGTRIVTDPVDPRGYEGRLMYRAFDEPADVVTQSHDHADHSGISTVKGHPVIIKGAGKFKANEVEFLGVETYHDSVRGAERGRNTVFIMKVDGLHIAHFGDLGHVLKADQAAQIGAVDIALMPVGGYYTIDAAQAWQVAEQVSAQIVIPMHFSNEKCKFPITGVDEFTAGKPRVIRRRKTTLEITAKDIPAEMTIVVLEPTL